MRKASLIVTVFIVALAIGYFIHDVRVYEEVQTIKAQPHMSWLVADQKVVSIRTALIRTVVISALVIAFEWLFLMTLPEEAQEESDSSFRDN
jgi:hypothetical protein